jgi:hypothetical protein
VQLLLPLRDWPRRPIGIFAATKAKKSFRTDFRTDGFCGVHITQAIIFIGGRLATEFSG